MSCKVNNEEIKPKVKTVEEPVKEGKQETVEISENMEALADEKIEKVQTDSAQAVGHVPVPGTGGGKGTPVKK